MRRLLRAHRHRQRRQRTCIHQETPVTAVWKARDPIAVERGNISKSLVGLWDYPATRRSFWSHSRLLVTVLLRWNVAGIIVKGLVLSKTKGLWCDTSRRSMLIRIPLSVPTTSATKCSAGKTTCRSIFTGFIIVGLEKALLSLCISFWLLMIDWSHYIFKGNWVNVEFILGSYGQSGRSYAPSNGRLEFCRARKFVITSNDEINPRKVPLEDILLW